MSDKNSGFRFWIVGTPIGNLEDLSPRARQVIAEADVLACEDKRRAGRLCQLASIKRPAELLLLNEHTESTAIPKVLEHIEGGKVVAFISDAGMPTISDPGKELISALHEEGIAISTAPGPSAVSTALALSGMDANRYIFEGFLPRRGKKRTERLEFLAMEVRTAVLFESPYRLSKTIADLADTFRKIGDEKAGKAGGEDRRILIAKELTKMYETLWLGPLVEAADAIDSPAYKKGEYVIVIEGTPA